MRHLLLLIALTLLPCSALAGARPDADPRWHAPCESSWLEEPEDNPKSAAICVDHWLIYIYGVGWTADDLVLDPYASSGPSSVSYGDLKRTEAKLAQVCPWDSADRDPGYEVPRCKRAREGLGKMLSERLGLREHRGEVPISFEQPLKALLEGKPLTEEALAPAASGGAWSKATLRLFRNAPFARHGRPFQSADLTEFFYGPLSAERFGRTLKPDADYADSRLTEVDQANVRQIREAELGADR